VRSALWRTADTRFVASDIWLVSVCSGMTHLVVAAVTRSVVLRRGESRRHDLSGEDVVVGVDHAIFTLAGPQVARLHRLYCCRSHPPTTRAGRRR
jgi:hypothetical protein